MAPQAAAGFPATLSTWVWEIVRSTPEPARATLAELIIGAMLGGGGHVTRALLAVTPRRGWQAYHWMLERGRFRLLGLVAALCGVVRRETRGPRRFAIIDDTLAPRCSAKAPGAALLGQGARRRPARAPQGAGPVPPGRPCRKDPPGRGPAAGGRRPPRAAVPAARRLV